MMSQCNGSTSEYLECKCLVTDLFTDLTPIAQCGKGVKAKVVILHHSRVDHQPEKNPDEWSYSLSKFFALHTYYA